MSDVAGTFRALLGAFCLDVRAGWFVAYFELRGIIWDLRDGVAGGFRALRHPARTEPQRFTFISPPLGLIPGIEDAGTRPRAEQP